MKKENLNNENNTFLAQWLEGTLTDNELKALVSQEDYLVYLKLKKGLDIKAGLDAPVDASFTRLQEKLSKRGQHVKPLYKNWFVGIAASIIVLIGLFMFVGGDSDVIIETGFGENRTIALLDGSEVILNSKSKIIYDKDNWDNERKLFLSGEAYFKVSKGESFVVSTDNGSITVLGTEFNVNSVGDYFDVICYEGKVQVKTKESQHILTPENAVRTIHNTASKTYKVSEKSPTWIKGESTFRSVPIYQVVKALENNYDVKFDTKNINNEELFTGSFPHDSLNIALKTVFETLNITYFEKEKRNIKLRYKE